MHNQSHLKKNTHTHKHTHRRSLKSVQLVTEEKNFHLVPIECRITIKKEQLDHKEYDSFA